MSKIVFFHIPKTGGTSLHDFLTTQIDEELICPDRLNTLKDHSLDYLNKFTYFSGHYDFDSIKRIPGDKKIFTFMRKPKDRIISLYYFWKSHKNEHIEKHNLGGPRIAKRLSFLDFLRYKNEGIPANIDNYIARVLSGSMYCGPNQEFLYSEEKVLEIAKKNVSEMFSVGFMDNYDKSYTEIVKKLGFNPPQEIPHSRKGDDHQDPNREKITREPIDEEALQELRKLTRLDDEIYKYCRELFL
ncbi:hypothetical protein AWR38_16810 [Idiomarina sp. WRN-38]|nr:hypothetical protein AUR68_16790 [Idiomarina sp. H105]OAE99537.1 hypothetical protein AWR38_16810 [Idiomarina sp. WRN-38]